MARFVGRKMEKLAVNMLDECQDANAAKTEKLLEVSRPNWGSSSCIKIAFSAANYEFTSHDLVCMGLCTGVGVWYLLKKVRFTFSSSLLLSLHFSSLQLVSQSTSQSPFNRTLNLSFSQLVI